MADGIATTFLFHVMAGVIAQLADRMATAGGSGLLPGRCYSQGADGCSWVYLF